MSGWHMLGLVIYGAWLGFCFGVTAVGFGWIELGPRAKERICGAPKR